jgi:hypothetical protein
MYASHACRLEVEHGPTRIILRLDRGGAVDPLPHTEGVSQLMTTRKRAASSTDVEELLFGTNDFQLCSGHHLQYKQLIYTILLN